MASSDKVICVLVVSRTTVFVPCLAEGRQVKKSHELSTSKPDFIESLSPALVATRAKSTPHLELYSTVLYTVLHLIHYVLLLPLASSCTSSTVRCDLFRVQSFPRRLRTMIQATDLLHLTVNNKDRTTNIISQDHHINKRITITDSNQPWVSPGPPRRNRVDRSMRCKSHWTRWRLVLKRPRCVVISSPNAPGNLIRWQALHLMHHQSCRKQVTTWVRHLY